MSFLIVFKDYIPAIEKTVTDNSRRIFPRIEIESLVTYLLVDRDRSILGQGVGKVVNLSQGGVMLQTHDPIKAPFALLSISESAVGEATILGQVTYCREIDPGECHVGIKFLGNAGKKRGMITGLVKSHSRLKHLK